MLPLISSADLRALSAKKKIVLLDARTGPDAFQKYQAYHLRGACYVDLNRDLATLATNPAEGGRHALPAPAAFAIVLGQLGIRPETHVVVYDDKSGANAAARFWWMLRAAGHAAVQVLDGGLPAALQAGFDASTGPEALLPETAYPFTAWQLPTATAAEVAQAIRSGTHLVIDVRDANRYRGETEPIDLIAGHIPGAINVPFTSNLAPDGTYLGPEQLRGNYRQLIQGRPTAHIIVHCGSGVTACHTLLALAQAGLGIAALYVGSWSEWSRSGREIATGE